MESKRAQAWGFDLMIAIVLFTIGIIAFYLYTLNYASETEKYINPLDEEANRISALVFSEGYPLDWNTITVSTPGIMSNNKINQTKLEMFYNLSLTDYKKVQSLLRTNYNFYLYFSEPMAIQGAFMEGIGNKSINPKNLIKTTKFTIYQEKTMTAYLEIWE